MLRKHENGVLSAIGGRLRGGPAPGALLGQAQACAAAAAQAADFFRRPTAANAFAVHESRLRSRREAAAAATVLRAGRDPRRRDWLTLSRRLAEAAEEGAAAVAEAHRFGAAENPAFAGVSSRLREAAGGLAAALAALRDGPRCEALLVAAKRRAAEAERQQRLARAAALDDPNAVADLKVRTVLRRMSRAAEAWQQAADLVAEVLEVLG